MKPDIRHCRNAPLGKYPVRTFAGILETTEWVGQVHRIHADMEHIGKEVPGNKGGRDAHVHPREHPIDGAYEVLLQVLVYLQGTNHRLVEFCYFPINDILLRFSRKFGNVRTLTEYLVNRLNIIRLCEDGRVNILRRLFNHRGEFCCQDFERVWGFLRFFEYVRQDFHGLPVDTAFSITEHLGVTHKCLYGLIPEQHFRRFMVTEFGN